MERKFQVPLIKQALLIYFLPCLFLLYLPKMVLLIAGDRIFGTSFNGTIVMVSVLMAWGIFSAILLGLLFFKLLRRFRQDDQAYDIFPSLRADSARGATFGLMYFAALVALSAVHPGLVRSERQYELWVDVPRFFGELVLYVLLLAWAIKPSLSLKEHLMAAVALYAALDFIYWGVSAWIEWPLGISFPESISAATLLLPARLILAIFLFHRAGFGAAFGSVAAIAVLFGALTAAGFLTGPELFNWVLGYLFVFLMARFMKPRKI